jgi:hypothetical protein
MRSKWIGLILLGMLSGQLQANEWVRNIEVVQIGTYQATTDHFVWFTTTPAECQEADPARPIMRFSETQPGGKALLATLMTALVNKRRVDLQASGCSVVEIYLK